MFPIFQFTEYCGFLAEEYALQSGIVFSSTVLIISKFFLPICITFWVSI